MIMSKSKYDNNSGVVDDNNDIIIAHQSYVNSNSNPYYGSNESNK